MNVILTEVSKDALDVNSVQCLQTLVDSITSTTDDLKDVAENTSSLIRNIDKMYKSCSKLLDICENQLNTIPITDGNQVVMMRAYESLEYQRQQLYKIQSILYNLIV